MLESSEWCILVSLPVRACQSILVITYHELSDDIMTKSFEKLGLCNYDDEKQIDNIWHDVCVLAIWQSRIIFDTLYLCNVKFKTTLFRAQTSSQTFSVTKWISINIWMSWRMMNNKKIGEGVRFQNGRVQKLSYVKVVKYAK